ncbi:MAG: hypothetical protein ACREI8_04185 [Myxococcota bacterium]
MELVDVSSVGRIDSSTFGPGPGGEVTIHADAVSVRDAGSAIVAKTAGDGAGGRVSIDAGRLEVSQQGAILVESRPGLGDSSAIFRDLVDSRTIPPFGDSPFADGRGGDLEVRAREVLLTSGSLISAESTGSGEAGSVTVTAEALRAEDGSEISVRATSSNGGDVGLTVTDRLELVDSTVTANVEQGVGGNVVIDAASVVLENGDIEAKALKLEGAGGAIDIAADAFIQDPDSELDASAGDPRLSGTVTVDAPDVDLAGSLAALSDSALDASDRLAERCSARRSSEGNGSFMIAGAAAGTGGLAPRVDPGRRGAARSTLPRRRELPLIPRPAGARSRPGELRGAAGRAARLRRGARRARDRSSRTA